MEILDNRSRSLRRRSHPISSLSIEESDQSRDSDIFYDSENSNRYTLENVEDLCSSPERVMSADNAAFSQPQDESSSARKRVRHACDFCRRKKCKVLLHLIASSNFSVRGTRRVTSVRKSVAYAHTPTMITLSPPEHIRICRRLFYRVV
jgi:hypothetical protein